MGKLLGCERRAGVLLAQQRGNSFRRYRPGVKIPLPVIASACREKVMLRLGFDTFRDDLDTETSPKVYDRVYYGRVRLCRA